MDTQQLRFTFPFVHACRERHSATSPFLLCCAVQLKANVDEMLEGLPPQFPHVAHERPVDEVALFIVSEWQLMDSLLNEIRGTLTAVVSSLSDRHHHDASTMDSAVQCVYTERVPEQWIRMSYPSLRPLGSWFADMVDRCTYLLSLKPDMPLPKLILLSRLARVKAFTFAIAQLHARRNSWAIERVHMVPEVTNRSMAEIMAPSRDGAYVAGVWLYGARFNQASGMLEDGVISEELSPLSVIQLKAKLADECVEQHIEQMPLVHASAGGIASASFARLATSAPCASSSAEHRTYHCPMYCTHARRGAIMIVPLQSTGSPIQWLLSGVTMLLDPYLP